MLSTNAIQRAIDETNGAGDGIVCAPAGTLLTGGLELKSRVTLYLKLGCVLLGSTSIGDYDYHPGPSPHPGDKRRQLPLKQSRRKKNPPTEPLRPSLPNTLHGENNRILILN
jgi:polygalacturonase